MGRAGWLLGVSAALDHGQLCTAVTQKAVNKPLPSENVKFASRDLFFFLDTFEC